MKKSTQVVLYVLFFGIASVVVSTPVFATNGMNLEGYGPIATGMGGASMAYDNGDAAMMNNPATLGLMPQGDRLDVALGFLGPHVKATDDVSGQSSTSSANAFYMPALGWVRKDAQMSYGLGMFSQGGMGTEFSADSFLAYGSGDKVRTEISVGRVLVPVAYEVNKDLSIGGSLDFVWAGMDLKMALSGQQFLDMAASGSQTYGAVSGSMMTAFNNAVAGGFISNPMIPGNPMPVEWGRFDFSDSSAFTGKAKSTGYGAKLGGVYKVNNEISIGATYHSKTALSDMKTESATVSFGANVDNNVLGGTWNGIPVGMTGSVGTPAGTYSEAPIPVTGTIKIKDFNWPQMVGIGMAYQASDNLMIVADYKWINWAAVMKNFKMTFEADGTQEGLAQGFAGTELEATMYQKWKDQNVIMLGAGYKLNPEWIVRAGINYANNPIPDTYLNSLFPAIEKTHVTVGAGYIISKATTIDASFTYAPEVKQTSGAGAPEGSTVTHSQTNAQVMYSYRF